MVLLPRLALVIAFALPAGLASAQDGPITTAAGELPAATEAPAPLAQEGRSETPEEIGAWAQGVLDGVPATPPSPDERQASCRQAADHRPHGEVWASVGTGGHRSVGGVVTHRLGDCGALTLGASHSRARFEFPHFR